MIGDIMLFILGCLLIWFFFNMVYDIYLDNQEKKLDIEKKRKELLDSKQ